MNMNLKSILCFIVIHSWISLIFAENVNVLIQGATPIAKTDDNFVCVTLDWWPSEKCSYNQCLWGKAGLLNLDLGKKILINTIKAFGSLRIKLGGSLQDQVVYNIGRVKDCPQFKETPESSFGFSGGCLSMVRWDQLNNLFNKTGAKVSFGLNALIGKKKTKKDPHLWIGNWQSQNARDLMNYTISKGYKIDSYEFGNALCGLRIGAKVKAKQYGKDVIVVKNLVKELYPDPQTRPKILGPGGFYIAKPFNTFLKASRQEVDGITHHIYNLGPGDDPNIINKIQDPFYLNQVTQTYKDVSNTVNKFRPPSGAWISKSGGAFNGGSKDVSPTFADGFWKAYLDQLGMASTYNHKVFCRQTFVGGNYALLNSTTFIPNPDYYGALLWNRLMDSTVLAVTQDTHPNLRVYAHCAKIKPGICLLFINLSKHLPLNVTLLDYESRSSNISRTVSEFSGYQNREEYHLTSLHGNIQGDLVLLNDIPMVLTHTMDIPPMDPKFFNASTPISIAPHSMVYVTIRDFNASACA